MAKRYQQGCVEVVQLDDRLTVGEVEGVRPLFADAAAGRLPQIVVDLRRLRVVDSAGLELLSDASRDCRRRGGSMAAAGAPALVRDVLRVTGLEAELSQFDDVAAAAGAFAQ